MTTVTEIDAPLDVVLEGLQEDLVIELVREPDDPDALVATASTGLSPSDVAIVSQYWQDEVDGVLTPYVGEVYTGSATSVALGLAEGFPSDEMAGIPLVADEFQLAFMQQISGEFVGLGEDVWEDVRTVLVHGIQNGESIEQIAAKMMQVSQFTQQSAERVARTVVHASAEAGSIAQLRFVGYNDDEVEKEWLATHDKRTRPTHAAADQQKVPLSSKFTVGGTKLDYPGDPLGAYDEIVRCRCTALFNIHEPPKHRCNGTVTAASTPPSASVCVIPTPTVDVSHIQTAVQIAFFNAFMKHKVSPAYGGAKIFKTIETVQASDAQFAPMTPWEAVAILDKYKTGPGGMYTPKFAEWAQTANGKKALSGFPPPTNAVTAPVSHLPSVPSITLTPSPHLPTLPPIAPKPGPGDIVFTGQTLGSHGAQVWQNPLTGEKWLFKPQSSFLTDLDVGIAKLQSKALQTRPAIYKMTLNGQSGSLQYMFESTSAWPGGSFDPLKLTAAEIAVLQREQIFDWMISNFDTHSGQWIRLADGTIYGTDKGQAFKFFGHDKLDWSYVPVTPLGSDKLTYSAMWKAFTQGKDIDLTDPTQGEIGEFLQRLMTIDDQMYKDLIRPYAAHVKTGAALEKFLDDAVLRKNSLQTDFADFWQKALTERAKHITPPVTPPVSVVMPTPLGSTLTPALDGDISTFDYFAKQDILDDWKKLGGGKKVTPAWGGAKIWKMLDDLYKQEQLAYAHAGLTPPTHLQLLRILDDVGGFKGKPKTYEGELLKWIESPAGKKAVPNVPSSLKVNPPTPVVTPVAPSPAAVSVAGTDRVATAFISGEKGAVNKLFVKMKDYNEGDDIAVVKTANGDTLRASRSIGGTINIEIRKDSLGQTTWTLDKSGFMDWTDILVEYNIKSTDQWSFFPPTKTVVTHIPGKTPGDPVSFAEIWASRYLWKQDDVIAEFNVLGSETRIISHGNGDLEIQNKYHTGPDPDKWVTGGVFQATDHVDPSIIAFFDTHPWKLAPDAIVDKSSTLFAGKSVGDAVTIAEIQTAGASTTGIGTVPLAYGFDGSLQWAMFNEAGSTLYKIGYRVNPNGSWNVYMFADAHELDKMPGGPNGGIKFQWYAATNDGKVPDVVKAMTPNVGAPGAATPAKIPGKFIGDKVSITDVALNAGSYDDLEILATGVKGTTGWEYRIYKVNGGFVLEGKHSAFTGGAWELAQVMETAAKMKTNITTSLPTVDWTLVAQKAAANSVQVKAAKKAVKAALPPVKKTAKAAVKKATKAAVPPPPVPSAPAGPTLLHGTDTHFPGKVVGDEIDNNEIFAHMDKYVDGQVIGYIDKYAAKYRIFMMDGHLLLQKQSASGSWIGTKKVSYPYMLPSSTWNKFKASNDMISAPNKKAAQKFVNTKLGGPATPSSGVTPATKIAKTGKKAGPAVAPSVPFPTGSFVMRHVDTSLWDETEQEEIYQFFRGKHIYVSTDPQSMWNAVQAVKSHFQTSKGGKYLNLNEVEILRIVDHRSSIKHGVTDTHPFEAKIQNWLKTPAGKAWVNKRIDAPIAAHDVPVPMSRIADPGDPPLDNQTYSSLGSDSAAANARARAIRTDDYAKHGAPAAAQKAALKKYTGGVYSSWNDAIRKGDISSYRNDIISAQRGMRPSTHAMLLHRKVGWPEFNDPTIHSYDTLLPYVGRTYINRGFNSSATTSGVWSGDVHLEIECPVGTPMAHVQDYSHHPSENETILAAHLIYEILSVKKNGATTVVRVRVIGAATP